MKATLYQHPARELARARLGKSSYECGPYPTRDEALLELEEMARAFTGERVEFDGAEVMDAPEVGPSVLGRRERQLRLI